MSVVAIVDYGLCNLDSVARAVEECGATPVVTDDPRDVEKADRIIDERLARNVFAGESPIGKRFSGKYLLTSTTHIYTPEEGYTTLFSVNAKRPYNLLSVLEEGRDGERVERREKPEAHEQEEEPDDEDQDKRMGDMACQCRLIDHAAAAGVDQHRPGPQRLAKRCIDELLRLTCGRDVHSDHDGAFRDVDR